MTNSKMVLGMSFGLVTALACRGSLSMKGPANEPLSTGRYVNGSYVPDSGFVPDSMTAVRIAEAVLTPIYGVDHIRKEGPFGAKLEGNVWTVWGYLPPDHQGGVAEVQIAKGDARILKVTHGK